MPSLDDPTHYDPDAISEIISERYLIGWLLAKPDYWHLVTEEVRPEDFYVPVHQKAVRALYEDGHLTAEELAARVRNIDPSVFAHWAVEAQLDLDTRQVRHRAVLVAKLAMRRKMLAAATAIVTDANDPAIGEDEVIIRAKDRLDQIVAPSSPPEDPVVPVDVFMARGGADDEYDWIFPDLLERRERMLVTAVAGVGKSTLLRQFALCGAAGIHPFTGMPCHPVRVLLLDLENSEKQVRRKMRDPGGKVGPFDSSLLHVGAHPRVIDVTTDAGWRWLAGQAAIAKPDLIVAGPVYRMYEGGDLSKDMGGRDKARQVAAALDRLRDRYNCALVVEAHPPKGVEHLSPHGSAVWEWWPEYGVGLKRNPEEPGVVTLTHWRLPRDERDWPQRLAYGGKYGFSVIQ